MATYEELDARLSVVAADASDAVADVVAVARGRSTGADRTPAEAIKVLDGWYLKHQATEAGARAAGVGPATASLDRTMVYLLALADIHGVDLTEPERRKALLMAVLLGDEGARLATKALTGQGATWARRLVSLPRVGNPLLGQLVGKALETGLSVALAAGGESIQARTVAAQAHRAFGAPPATFPGQRPRASTPRPEPRQRPRPIDEPSPTSAYARALARTVNKIKKAGRDT